MTTKWRQVMPGVLFSATSVLFMAAAHCAQPSGDQPSESKGNKAASSVSRIEGDDRVSIAIARDRAKTMHNVYAATLDVMHHRYFHRERAVVPARAMEDIFAEIKRQSNVEAQWISVNLKAMSIDHEPKSNFEKRAAREIAAGKPEIEVVEAGYYRRAGAIPMTGGCISCHEGFFREPTKTPKFAGLVISVPVIDAASKPK